MQHGRDRGVEPAEREVPPPGRPTASGMKPDHRFRFYMQNPRVALVPTIRGRTDSAAYAAWLFLNADPDGLVT